MVGDAVNFLSKRTRIDQYLSNQSGVRRSGVCRGKHRIQANLLSPQDDRHLCQCRGGGRGAGAVLRSAGRGRAVRGGKAGLDPAQAGGVFQPAPEA